MDRNRRAALLPAALLSAVTILAAGWSAAAQMTGAARKGGSADPAAKALRETVLVTVDGEKVTRGELQGYLARGMTMADYFRIGQGAQIYDEFLAKKIMEVLLLQEARRRGLESEVRRGVYRFQENFVVTNDYLRRAVWGGIKVTDAEAEARMPRHLGRYKVRQIVVMTLGEAEDTLERLKRGEEMKALVAERSIGPEARKEGELWDVREGVGYWPVEEEMKILDLQPGDLYGPFEMGLGWAIVRVEERTEATPEEFRRLRNKMRDIIHNERFEAEVQRVVGGIDFDVATEEELYPMVRDWWEKGTVSDAVVGRYPGLTVTFRDLTVLEKGTLDSTRVPDTHYKLGKLKAMPANLIREFVFAGEARKGKYQMSPAASGALETFLSNALIEELERRAIDPRVTVEEKEVRPYFEANRDRFSQKEAVRVRHILAGELTEALRILEDARAGMPFEAMARTYSMDPGSRDKGGDLGFVERGRFVKEFEEAAFSLSEPGELYREPIKSPYGYHVIRFEERRPAKTPAFEDIRPTVRRTMEEELRTRLKGEFVAALQVNADVRRDEEAIAAARAAFAEEFRAKTETKQDQYKRQHGPGRPGKYHQDQSPAVVPPGAVAPPGMGE